MTNFQKISLHNLMPIYDSKEDNIQLIEIGTSLESSQWGLSLQKLEMLEKNPFDLNWSSESLTKIKLILKNR